jgi:uncharacterized protein DUF6883
MADPDSKGEGDKSMPRKAHRRLALAFLTERCCRDLIATGKCGTDTLPVTTQPTADRPGPPVALFINAQDLTLADLGEYGPTVKHAVLAALLGLDPDRALQVQTWWGSLMLPVFRLAAADSDGSTLDPDYFLLWTSASTLVEEAHARWVVPTASVPWLLGTNDAIYLGVLVGLTAAASMRLHEVLTTYRWYVGMMTVDAADPLHYRVFNLLKGWRYNRGFITDDPSRFNPQEVPHGLPVGFGPGPRPWLDLHIGWKPSATAALERNPTTYQEALAGLLAHYTAERPLTFAVGRAQPTVDDLYPKLHDYALNPDHDKGGGAKAAFFRSALGIRREDWRLLAVQLLSALTTAAPEKFRDEPEWGQRQHLRFAITAPVFGLNGRTAMVTSAWKIEDDEPVQLVTLTPGKKEGIVEQHEALEAGDFAALYAIAVEVATLAQRACRPTPFAIKGGAGVEVYPGGPVGVAWVTLPDPRAPFAVWLLDQGHARGSHDGAMVGAPTTDYESAGAWANAFADVLQAAGHACTVTHLID